MDGMPVWLSTMILGLGFVFVGLFFLILFTRLMSILCAKLVPERKAASVAAPAIAPGAEQPEPADRGAFFAAVASCLASVMDTKAEGLRIVSVKRMD